jgi:hypothetical protein
MSAFASSGQSAIKLLGSYVPKGDLSRCSNVREQSCGYSITSSVRASSRDVTQSSSDRPRGARSVRSASAVILIESNQRD